jgi:hypothetical protein
MKETYGILGTGTSSTKVIQAALEDVGTQVHYYVPWYGSPTEGIEIVYDWLLDNEATFTVVANKTTKVPKALVSQATDVDMISGDVNQYLIETLKYGEVKGFALLLWDDKLNEASQALAERCIDAGLPTLELTNGLVPIVFDEEPAEIKEKVIEEDDPTDDVPEKFDRSTLENMPAAVVKRMAKDKGTTTKTKDEAIKVVLGEEALEKSPIQTDRSIVKVVVYYSDGMKMEL